MLDYPYRDRIISSKSIGLHNHDQYIKKRLFQMINFTRSLIYSWYFMNREITSLRQWNLNTVFLSTSVGRCQIDDEDDGVEAERTRMRMMIKRQRLWRRWRRRFQKITMTRHRRWRRQLWRRWRRRFWCRSWSGGQVTVKGRTKRALKLYSQGSGQRIWNS